MRKLRVLDIRLPIIVLSLAAVSLTACDRAEPHDSVASTGASASSPIASMPARANLMARDMSGPNVELQKADMAVAAAPPAAVSSRSDAAPETGTLLAPASDPAGAMLVRHGQASIEVRHVDDAVLRVRQAAQQLGGFVANTALRNGKDEQPSASLELRVPTAQFDQLMTGLKAFGRVESVSANAEDVGEEYVDLGARTANARRVEARLVEMLASRTGKLSDVLTVEQELARVRQEIERHDARLRWLERRASLSSFSITLHEPLALLDRQTNGPLTEAFAVAWRRLLGVIAWFIAALGVLVPIGILFGGLVVVVRRLSRGRRSGDAAATIA
jgi:hypothetical protein